jgi:hypothetical protein
VVGGGNLSDVDPKPSRAFPLVLTPKPPRFGRPGGDPERTAFRSRPPCLVGELARASRPKPSMDGSGTHLAITGQRGKFRPGRLRGHRRVSRPLRRGGGTRRTDHARSLETALSATGGSCSTRREIRIHGADRGAVSASLAIASYSPGSNGLSTAAHVHTEVGRFLQLTARIRRRRVCRNVQPGQPRAYACQRRVKADPSATVEN